MPKKGVTKATKSFTITMSNLAWLDEYCIKKNKKMSSVINDLINELRKQTEQQEQPINQSKDITCTFTIPANTIGLELVYEGYKIFVEKGNV